MQTQAKDYWKYFKPSACSLRLAGTTKEEVFAELVQNLVSAKLLGAKLAKPAIAALLERERLASTGIGQGVALPHVKLAGLEKPVFSLSLHAEGVDWASLDGAQARIFFLVLRPEQATESYDPDRHREVVAWIAQLCREPDFRSFALQVTTRTGLVDLLKEMSG